jgi:hypothetical protein
VTVALPISGVPALIPGSGPLLRSQEIAASTIVKLGSAEYRMFFVEERQGGGNPADYALDLLPSADGTTWNPANVTRNLIGSAQTGQTFNYYATELKEDGPYKLWQAATSDSNIAYTNLYYLTSTDGLHYTLQGTALQVGGGTPYDTRNIADPTVVRIGYATSPDGEAWTKHGPIESLGSGIFLAGAVKEGTIYRQWYTKDGGSGWNELWEATGEVTVQWREDFENSYWSANWTPYGGGEVGTVQDETAINGT